MRPPAEVPLWSERGIIEVVVWSKEYYDCLSAGITPHAGLKMNPQLWVFGLSALGENLSDASTRQSAITIQFGIRISNAVGAQARPASKDLVLQLFYWCVKAFPSPLP
jgi:hypothetical protein